MQEEEESSVKHVKRELDCGGVPSAGGRASRNRKASPEMVEIQTPDRDGLFERPGPESFSANPRGIKRESSAEPTPCPAKKQIKLHYSEWSYTEGKAYMMHNGEKKYAEKVLHVASLLVSAVCCFTSSLGSLA